MFQRRWSFKETNLLIKADNGWAIEAAIGAALNARRDIEQFIALHPEFRWSLEPLEPDGSDVPEVIRLMVGASKVAGVGPFAAVAGAIAQEALKAALVAGAKNVIVENGGDIAMSGNREFHIGLHSGRSRVPVAFRVRPDDLPLGICTSSGTVGHSVSFGEADAAVVFAEDAAIADAAATAVGNEVRGERPEEAIERGLERARRISRVCGCFIVCRLRVGCWGRVPELIPAETLHQLTDDLASQPEAPEFSAVL